MTVALGLASAAEPRHSFHGRRVLVTGAAGMLGSAILPALEESGCQVIRTDIQHGWHRLDVRDQAQVAHVVDVFNPALIIHLAAETSLETCERDPAHAWSTNALGTEHVARAAARSKIPLIYVSTAGVFDGDSYQPYVETDTPNPINEYGRSKLHGEQRVQVLCGEHAYVVRAGWMMGGGPPLDHKFVGTVVAQLRAGADTIHAVGDRYGSPTYAPDFARCLLRLAQTGRYGLYHLVSGGGPRRVDVAAHILNVLDLADQVELVTVDSDFFHDRFPTARPRSEVLRNAALEDLGLNAMRPWDLALIDYLTLDFAGMRYPVGSSR
jgi:dTDP-4-dehydrorhamnose reductase